MATNSQAGVVEITVCNDEINRPVLFRPAKTKVRGEFSYHRAKESAALELAGNLPGPIPGQRIRLEISADGSAVGSIVEPLYEPQYATLRRIVETKTGKLKQLPPERRMFKKCHAPTWLFYMQKIVNGGNAKLTTGEFPAELGGKPNHDYLTKKRVGVVEQLTTALTALLGAKQAAPATATAAAQ